MKPELFTFNLFGSEYTIYSFGFFLVVSLVVATLIIYWQAGKRGLTTKHIIDNILWIVIGGIVGGRLGYVIINWGFYSDNLREIFYFWQGGFAFYGALVGGLAVALGWLYWKKKGEVGLWLDSFMVALATAHGIGMIGSFLVGSNFGKPSSLPWAIAIPLLGDEAPRHPTQIYEAILYFVIALLLILLSRNWKKYFGGFVFLLGLSLQSAVRLAVDFFRVRQSYVFGEASFFTIEQALSILLIVTCIIAIIVLHRRKKSAEAGKQPAN